MACSYKAPNENESKLFDGLFSYFKDNGKSEEEAEREAVKIWLTARTDTFIERFGNWAKGDTSLKLDVNGEPLLVDGKFFETDKALINAITGEDVYVGTGAIAPAADHLGGIGNSFVLLQKAIKLDNRPKLARSIILGAKSPIPIAMDSSVKVAAYNAATNTIKVNPAVELSQSNLYDVVMTEALVAHLSKEGNITTDNLYELARTTLEPKGVTFEGVTDKFTFYNKLLSSTALQQAMKDNILPGTATTLWDTFVNHLKDRFDLRVSQIEQLQDMVQINSSFYEGGKPMYMADAPVMDDEEVETETKTGKVVDNPAAPFAHLLSGDAVSDTYITATFNKIQSLKEQIKRRGKATENARLKVEIAKYQAQLNDLVEKRNIALIIETGKKELKRMEEALKEDLDFEEIGANHNLMEAWSQFSTFFDLTDSDMKDDIWRISAHANDLKHKFYELYAPQLQKIIGTTGLSAEYLADIDSTKVIEDIGSLKSNLEGLSFGTNGLEVAGDHIIRIASYKTNQAMMEFENKLAKQLKLAGPKVMEKLFIKDASGRRRPITKYKTELYETMAGLNKEIFGYNADRKPLYDRKKELNEEYYKAKRAGDREGAERIYAEIKEVNTKIEEHKKATKSYESLTEFERKNFTFELSDEGRQEYEEFKEAFKQDFMDWSTELDMMVIDQEAYDRAIRDYDIDAFETWLKDGGVRPRHAGKFFTIKPKDEWLDPSGYNTLSTAEQEFYDFFVTEFLAAQAEIPMDYNFTDYDSDKLLREFAVMDKETASKFKNLSTNITDFFKDTVMVKSHETTISTDGVSPFSKNKVKRLKGKNIKDFILKEDGYFYEGEPLPGWAQTGLDESRYKWKDGMLVTASKETLLKRKEQITDDPLKIFVNFKKFSLSYKFKKEVESTLNAIKELANEVEVESEDRKGVSDLLGKRSGGKNNSNFSKRIEHTTNAFLYGDTKTANKGITKGKPGKRVFSIEQAVESLNNFTRIRQLGLNMASGFANLGMGTVSNLAYAGRQEFFNEKDLFSAYNILKSSVLKWSTGNKIAVGESKKVALLAKRFNLLDNMKEDFYSDNAWMEKLMEKMYLFQSSGEYLNQMATAIAMMRSTKVKNAAGEEVSSLWDAYEVVDDELVFKHSDTDYNDQMKEMVFSEAVKKVNKEIHGDYDTLNPMLFKKKLIGRLIMLFRTWMPQAVKQRFGSRYKDYQLSMFKGEDVFREGRYRSFGRLFMDSKGALGKTGYIGKMIGATLLSTLSNKMGRKVIDTMVVDSTDRANMYMNMKELWWIMASSALTSFMFALAQKAEDDEDDEKVERWLNGMVDMDDPIQSSVLQYAYNQFSRVETELRFFYDPLAISKILRDAIPMWTTIKQLIRVMETIPTIGQEEGTYKRGFRKGDSKFMTQLEIFFPVIRQRQSIWSMAAQIYSDKYY